jgi:NTE family protein
MRKNETYPAPDVRGKRVVLLLQGGGALGAYQVGAFEALQAHLERHGKERIDWVAGISIGAINAAVIAGNKPEDLRPSCGASPPSKLERLWKEISWPGAAPPARASDSPPWRTWNERRELLARYAGFNWAATLGQSHFFDARLWSAWTNPWIAQWWRDDLKPSELGNYDTGPLRATLSDPGLIDWGLINAPSGERTRLSLGAALVTDAEMEFFDSDALALSPEHVLASSALPPAFPPIRIDGKSAEGEPIAKYYFDGGVCSNTPLLDLQDELGTEPTIVFDIHVWDRQGAVPRTMDEVSWRQKCIQYGSRKRIAELIVDRHQHRPAAAEKPTLVIYQVMYEYKTGASGDPGDSAFAFSDADFSPASLELRRELGRRDMDTALESPKLVEGVGGDRAALYRHGTYDKHVETDLIIARRAAATESGNEGPAHG